MVKEKGLGLLRDSVALGFSAPLILGQRMHTMTNQWGEHSQNNVRSGIVIGDCRIGHPNKFYLYFALYLFVIAKERHLDLYV